MDGIWMSSPALIREYSALWLHLRQSLNKVRPHLSLDKDAPDFRWTKKIGRIAAIRFSAGSTINMSGFGFSLGTGASETRTPESLSSRKVAQLQAAVTLTAGRDGATPRAKSGHRRV